MRLPQADHLEHASCSSYCYSPPLPVCRGLPSCWLRQQVCKLTSAACSSTRLHKLRAEPFMSNFDPAMSDQSLQPATAEAPKARAPFWIQAWIYLSNLIFALVARVKRWLGFLLAPRPANVAEARQEAQRKAQEQGKLGSASIHSKEYKMALARTRQAVSIQKALQYQRQSNPVRAKVELQRALSENAVCRAPLLAARYTKEQMQGLYKLHLETTELPPNYAHLLQLQDMLDIDKTEAEQLETEVMANAAAFSI